jgi:TM2 domain-containing membrane protein YozV
VEASANEVVEIAFFTTYLTHQRDYQNMRNKYVAAILALFVGFIGVHRFYLGQKGLGIAYLLFFWTAIPAVLSFIDGILFLVMDEDAFNEKYNKEYLRRMGEMGHLYRSKPADRVYSNRHLKQQPAPQAAMSKSPGSQAPVHPDWKLARLHMNAYEYQEAARLYESLVAKSPKNPELQFEMAQVSSLLEDKWKAFGHLERAVEYGLSNLERIRTNEHLAWLRTQEEFEQFVTQGYRQGIITQQDATNSTQQDNLVQQLYRLTLLMEQGNLTQEEFDQQKKQLLKRNT